MSIFARLLGGCRFVRPQPAQQAFLYSWAVGDTATGFSRASAADYVDAQGVVKTAAANTPRVALDPTGEVGLLIEEAQAFAWSRTGDFSSAAGVWSRAFLLDPTTDGRLGPDGVTPAQKIVPDTATVNSHRLARSAPDATNDTAQTVIMDWLEAGYRYLTVTPITKDGAAYASVLDIATGTIVQRSTQHAISVLPLSGGFYRWWVTANAKHGATTMSWRVALSDSPVPGTLMAGDGVKGAYCALLQMATDCDHATSPMSAAATAPTRAAESWTVTGAVDAPHVGKAGTLYEKYFDRATGQLVEKVTAITSLTADFSYTAGRSYRAVRIALGNRTLSEMQGSPSAPPTPVATSVSLTPTIAALSAGQTMQLSAAVRDQDGNAMAGEVVTYSSSDTGVATVTSAGAVTAVAAGSATITATNGALTATCSLTVSAVAAGSGFQYDSYPHSTTGVLFTYTDFRTSYFANTTAGNAQRETERNFLAQHVDKVLSAGEPTGGYPVGLIHQPYILTSWIAVCVHDTDEWNNGRSKTEKIFTDWCTTNGLNPEDGYLHYPNGATTYGMEILSIDTAGQVTLKYDFVTYADALANGMTVTIANASNPVFNGSWTISGVGVTGGDLDDNGDLRRAKTVFTIPKTGSTATIGGVATRLGDGTKTKRNRFIFLVGDSNQQFPPPRWIINHAHPTRIAFERERLATIATGGYGVGFQPEGCYVDEISQNTWGKFLSMSFVEYPSPDGAQWLADMAAFYRTMQADYPDNPWMQEIGTGSYMKPETTTLIDTGPKCTQLEQFVYTRKQFEWMVGNSSFEWARDRLRAGDYIEWCTPFFPTDNIAGGGGSYASDPVPAGCRSAANVRMYASVFVLALLAQVKDKPWHIAVNIMNGAWNPTDPNAGLNNRWIKLFEVDLGMPVDEPARVVTGQKDTKNQGVTIAGRQYERGMVVYRRVDADPNTCDYTATYAYAPPASSGASGLWSRVKSDGSLDVPSATFNLASDEGIILVPADAPPETPTGTTYHVTTSGTSGGDGSSGSPWSLSYALGGAGGAIQPGDTVEVAAGTYTGNFTSTLAGTVASPITVKAAAGARATIDGTLVCAQAGQYTWFWGLEVKRSVTDADVIGVNSFGTGNRFIHCVIHDHPSNGLGMWSEGPGQEAYGNIIYNNGYSGQDTSHSAHGIYTQNLDGFKKIKHNVIFDQYGYGIHCYGSELVHTDGYTIAENVLVNNGRGNAVGQSGGLNFLIENGNPVVGMTFTGNLSYLSSGAADTAGRIGSIFDADVVNDGATITDNYVMGLLLVGFWKNMTFTGNTVVQREDYLTIGKYFYADQPPVGGTWDGNTYRSIGTGNQFQTVTSAGASSGRTFSDWKTTMGVDAASTFTAALPTVNKVVVQPSEYETGRANIVIFNWASASTVDVDVSGVLSDGDTYELKDVNDFYGTAVATGTVASGTITIALAEKTPPASVSAIGTMPSTGTAFKAYVIRKT